MANRPGYGKEYYWRNRERIREQANEWSKKNSAKVLEHKKRYYTNNIPLQLYKAAKCRATQYGHEFTIEVSDIVVPEVCPILKQPLVPRTRYAASIDRIDNSKGYTKDNIRVISRRANTMKNDATNEDLKYFAEWILNDGG